MLFHFENKKSGKGGRAIERGGKKKTINKNKYINKRGGNKYSTNNVFLKKKMRQKENMRVRSTVDEMGCLSCHLSIYQLSQDNTAVLNFLHALRHSRKTL